MRAFSSKRRIDRLPVLSNAGDKKWSNVWKAVQLAQEMWWKNDRAYLRFFVSVFFVLGE